MSLADLASFHTEQLAGVAGVLDSELLVAAMLLVVTTGVIGLCVPGLLMPLSFSAGLLMESWLAVPVVAAGAVLGSQGLFLAARRGMGKRLQQKLASRLANYSPHMNRYGIAYVAGLRVVGTPHALVTLASAASPLRHGRFALASLLGFLPSIIISAGAGSAF
jgi:uncharacterized membrane protein YdjX (TVP38/TMEM64 family)